MNKIGIYKIVNKINQKSYVGSSVRLIYRHKRHLSDLRTNQHHSLALQRAYNKYGESNFEFTIIEYCNNSNILEREQYYIDALKPEYNICRIAGNCLGIKHSKETINKRAESLKRVWKNKNLGISKTKQLALKSFEENSIIRQEKEQRNLQIIEDLKSGVRQDIIAEKYNLSPSVITQLKKKNDIKIETFVRRGQNNNFSKLTEEQVKEIKYLLRDKVKQQTIADKYNVKLRTIKAIQSGQNWNHITIE